ncbi:MAG: hypothetical protein HY544_02525 [Candidatus Diapherotrites archaeon]|uniref:Type II toxin-antitoxin system VapC family toxin n=1 Tax=Candidatus Iainarchaeum sp. TaxID=3101447 RepID=A0A8T3YQC4_9ARCH|nr:hypothetical protein [Candidatus Diapherotrites archaeon]
MPLPPCKLIPAKSTRTFHSGGPRRRDGGVFEIPINESVIIEANGFRKENKRLKMPYIDCLGYAIARSRGIKFLTGDNAFKGLENVEFVK